MRSPATNPLVTDAPLGGRRVRRATGAVESRRTSRMRAAAWVLRPPTGEGHRGWRSGGAAQHPTSHRSESSALRAGRQGSELRSTWAGGRRGQPHVPGSATPALLAAVNAFATDGPRFVLCLSGDEAVSSPFPPPSLPSSCSRLGRAAVQPLEALLLRSSNRQEAVLLWRAATEPARRQTSCANGGAGSGCGAVPGLRPEHLASIDGAGQIGASFLRRERAVAQNDHTLPATATVRVRAIGRQRMNAWSSYDLQSRNGTALVLGLRRAQGRRTG